MKASGVGRWPGGEGGKDLTSLPNTLLVLELHPGVIERPVGVTIQEANLLGLIPYFGHLNDLLAILVEHEIAVGIRDGNSQVFTVEAALEPGRRASHFRGELPHVGGDDFGPVHLPVHAKIENEIDLLLGVLAVCTGQTGRVSRRLPLLLLAGKDVREGRYLSPGREGEGRRGKVRPVVVAAVPVTPGRRRRR